MYIHFANLVRGFSPKTPPAHSNCTYICLYVLQSFASPDASDCSLPVMLDIHRAAHLFAPRCPLFLSSFFHLPSIFLQKKTAHAFLFFYTSLFFISRVFTSHLFFSFHFFSELKRIHFVFSQTPFHFH